MVLGCARRRTRDRWRFVALTPCRGPRNAQDTGREGMGAGVLDVEDLARVQRRTVTGAAGGSHTVGTSVR